MYRYIILLLILSAYYTFSQIAPEWESVLQLNNNNQITIRSILNDNAGNLFILSTTNFDTNNIYGGYILTAKVNITGNLLWRKIYSRPGLDSGDFPVSMVLDNQNNIYVLNRSHGYTTGFDYGAIKYDQNGNFLWDYFFTSPGGVDSYDTPNAITVDNQSNCYLTGFSTTGFYTDSINTIKLNSAGSVQWIKKYAAISVRLNSGECIIADNQSNVYVGGYLNDTANGFLNAVLLKYNSSGVLQWTKTYNGTQNIADYYMDMKFDLNGNIVASGATDDDYYADSASVLLNKYNSGGTLIWSRVYHTINPSGEYGKKIIIDNNDNIYVMGQTQLYPYAYSSLTFALKYSSTGNLLWSKRHGDFYSTNSFPFNITFDNNQNILISGFEKKYGRTNIMLLKYDKNDGAQLWNYLYNRNGYSVDNALFSGIFNNTLYISGTSDNNFLLMKMQPTTTHTFTFTRNNLYKPILDSQYTYDTVFLNADLIPPAAYIKSINVSIDTIMHGAMGDIEIYLINGTAADTLFYRRGGPLDNMIGTNLNDTSALNICSNGLPPFTGYYAPCRPLSKHLLLPGNGPWILKIYDRKTPDTGFLRAWSLTLQYETIIGIEPISYEIPEKYFISQNYPNPFNPVTKIRFSIPLQAETKIIIYDINGKEIKTLVNEMLSVGIYETEFDGSDLASGVYFYKIETGDYSESRKMVLIK